DFSVKEGPEHANHRAEPSVISHDGDVAEIVPVLDAKHAVIPQRLKSIARKVLSDDIKHLDGTTLGYHRFSLGDERVAIILARHLADGFNRHHIWRQTLNKFEHCRPSANSSNEESIGARGRSGRGSIRVTRETRNPLASMRFSPNQVHWGGDSERIVLQPRFFVNPQDAPMPTECSPALFDFLPVEGRQVVASFDGGAITSDAGALLLGQTD